MSLSFLLHLTSVGYGDKVPTSIMGRLIACVWMITGIILFSVVNGSIILVMSLPRVPIDLTGLDDPRLNNSTVCSKYGAFEEYLGEHNRISEVIFKDSIAECYDLLVNEQVRISPMLPPHVPKEANLHFVCFCTVCIRSSLLPHVIGTCHGNRCMLNASYLHVGGCSFLRPAPDACRCAQWRLQRQYNSPASADTIWCGDRKVVPGCRVCCCNALEWHLHQFGD